MAPEIVIYKKRIEQLEKVYTELWCATEDGFDSDTFFKLRETFRKVMLPGIVISPSGSPSKT